MKKVKVKKSLIHGKGLFACEDIKKGETIRHVNGTIYFKKNTTVREAEEGPNWIVVDKALSVDPDFYFEHINHSCNPNVVFADSIKCVAICDIKKGEEIVLDYSTVEDNRFWSMNCSCGTKVCRKTVRSVQFLPEEVFHKYKPHITKHFVKKYQSRKAYERRKNGSK